MKENQEYNQKTIFLSATFNGSWRSEQYKVESGAKEETSLKVPFLMMPKRKNQ